MPRRKGGEKTGKRKEKAMMIEEQDDNGIAGHHIRRGMCSMFQ
jgi:hypothetical protein